MHSAAKVIIGLILIIIGLFLFVDSVTPLTGTTGTFGIDWLGNFIIVLTGIIPIFLILIGLFVVWLEIDELKTQKELSEEKKELPKTSKNSKKK
jgi:protein-S-isoprenylcysteine O-methyltransferase Ste14